MTEEATEIIETPQEPTPLPERTLTLQLQFNDPAGAEPTVYASNLEHPENLTAEQYAKAVAETVERTILLHLGALPVLAKQEVAA